MHVGAILIFEGPPPSYDDLVEHVRSRLHLVPRFRQKLAFPPVETGRPLLGRRPQLQPRLPRPPLGAARAGLRGAAAQHRRPRLLAAARPLQAALGAVAGAGAGAQPLRADHQDPPRAGRRRLRRRHRHRPLRPQAGARAGRARRRLGAAARAVLAPSWPRAGVADARRGARQARRAARSRRRATRRRRRAGWPRRLEALGEVAWAFADPAPERAAQRRDRLRTGASPGRARSWPTSSGSRTRSAAPSTTSSSPSSPARCASWLHSRGIAHRGARAARAGAGLDPRPRTSAASSATGSRRCAAPLPVYVEDPVRRLRRRQRRRWTGSSSPSRRSAPR